MAGTVLHLKLKGLGWADLEIVSEGSGILVPSISYFTDALGDLVRVGMDIATGRHFGAAVFDHQPATSVVLAETAWLQDDQWHSGARLSVARELPSFFEPTADWRASAQRDFIVELKSSDELARLFLDAALEVRREYGEEGYQQTWNGAAGYPRRAVAALEAALSAAPLDVVPYG